jgi:integrase
MAAQTGIQDFSRRNPECPGFPFAVRGTDPGPLFPAINKGERIIPGEMTDQAVYGIIAKRAKEAGLQHFSPHDLRRSFVSDMLDAGADVSMVH